MAFLDELNTILESAENYQEGNLFDGEEVLENVEEPDTEAFLREACIESAHEMYKLQGSLFIADVKMDQALIEATISQEDAQAVMEATIKEYANKAVQLLVKMKNAAMDFITNLINFLRAQATDANKFVQANKDKLQGRKGSYNMHEFTIAKGDQALDKALNDAQRFMGTNGEINSYIQGAEEKVKAHSGYGDKNTVAKNQGHANVGQLVQAIQDAYMSKEKSVRQFDCTSFMGVVTGRKSGLESVNKQKNEIAKAYDAAISTIKGYGTSDGEQSTANKMIAACRAELSVCNKLIAKKKEVLMLQHTECLAALKSVLSSTNKEYKAVSKADKKAQKDIEKQKKAEEKEAKKAEKKAGKEKGNEEPKEDVKESFMDSYQLDRFMDLLED